MSQQHLSPTTAPFIATHPNLRCLGGAAMQDGRRVRALRFLRAPAIATLDAKDAAWLDACDPAIIIDFRGTDEARESPVALPERLKPRRLAIPIEPSATPRFRFLHEQDTRAAITHTAVVEAMVDTYRDFVRLHADAYRAFLRAVAAAGDRPVLFHCTAGKDRTGLAAALLLTALGAPRNVIMRDYLATAALWKPDARLKARLPESAHAGVYGVSELYLDAAMDEFDRLHGGALAFICDALGGDETRRQWAARHLSAA